MSVYKVDKVGNEWVMTQVKELATDYTARIGQYLLDKNASNGCRAPDPEVRAGHELLRTTRPSAEDHERQERRILLQQTD